MSAQTKKVNGLFKSINDKLRAVFLNLFPVAAQFWTFSKFAAHLDRVS